MLRRLVPALCAVIIFLSFMLVALTLGGEHEERAQHAESRSRSAQPSSAATVQPHSAPKTVHHAPKLRKKSIVPVALPVAAPIDYVKLGLLLAAASDYHNWIDWPAWQCIGTHEQRGPGRDGIAWGGSGAGGSPGSGYPGGLGIMRAAWDENRVAAGVSTTNGAYATPADQIKVGRVIQRRFGWRAWATAGICGL